MGYSTGFSGGGYKIPSYNPGDVTTKGGIKRGLENQYGINTGLEQQQQGQRGSEYGTLMPQYQSLLDSGYSPQEKSAITEGTTGAISSAYGQASGAAGRHLATTGNTAGYSSLLGNLARNKAKDIAAQNNQNQVEFAQEAQRRKLEGIQGIANLYGVDTSFLNSLGQQQLGTLGIGSGVESRRKGVLGTMQNIGSAATLGLLG